MFKKAPFWIAFTLLSILLTVFASTYFSKAFPLVTLDLEMDRETALAEAVRLAESYGWGPEGFRQAASFGLDADVQSYVELEGGGKEAFGEMIRGDLFSPYTWQVRHFQPGETTETRIFFTPEGDPFGFEETLPEDAPGASLPENEARRLAEAGAARWNVDLGAYDLAEAAQETRPGGRTDHTFTFERRGVQVGEEGRYRLHLTLSGERFTALRHSVKVPEGFSRRYEKMRSANNFIAIAASMAMLVLYLGGGCGVGLFFLFRKRWVIWKPALLWGVFIAFLQLLVGLNQWPLVWMGYDTAVSTTNFALQNLAIQAAAFVGFALFFTLAFIGAESLTRRAFPAHLQFWKVWTRDVASSRQVLGYTVAGYLLVGVFFAYEVALYFFSHRVLGWWSPSDALFDPNSLATYFPWLTAIAISLQAGFMEECLFRAVPLAAAALLGRKLGRERLFVLAALLLQALIFGAAHANYPNQPAFARLVELILPSIGFGLVYLRFGLLPVIVLHFAFDVVWFALPLFVSDAPGAWLNQVVVVALALVPLMVAAAARLRTRRWHDAGEESYNRAWAPAPERSIAETKAPLPERAGIASRLRLALGVLGVAGFAAWIASSSFSSLHPPLEIGRGQAVEAADRELAGRGIELPASWKTLSAVQAGSGDPHRFVWTHGDESTFGALLGRYLPVPRWWVRYAFFEGDVGERAEEYQVWISGDGDVTRFLHRLPEGRPGADLGEDEARSRARAALAERYGLDASRLEEVSAAPAKQPARRDWSFVFKDAESWPLEQGEARLGVQIDGDEVTHVYRFVHLPERWQREERNRSTLLLAVRLISAGILLSLFAAAAVLAVVCWTRKKFAVGMFLRFAALMAVVGLVVLVNSVPAAQAGFSTAQPFMIQMLIVGAGSVGVVIAALVVAFAIGLVHGNGELAPAGRGSRSLVSGLALGAVAAGLSATLTQWVSSSKPPWADFSQADAWMPALGVAASDLSGFVRVSALLFLVFWALDTFTDRWNHRRPAAVALVLAVGLVLAGTGEVESLPQWLLAGLAQGALLWGAYVLVLRHDLTLIVPALAVTIVLGAVREGILQAYPGVLTGHVVGIVLVVGVAIYWYREARRLKPPASTTLGTTILGLLHCLPRTNSR